MRVLYLTQWYPHRYDAMAGLFVRNHAKAAVKQGIDVCVLYCHPVEPGMLSNGEEIEVVEQETQGVREVYIYHSCRALTALMRGRDEVVLRWGTPDMCQVNVLSKSALFAYEIFLRWKIPYVLVEHWSGYLPNNGDYLRNTGFFRRKIYERIARNAACILPVSQFLQESMQACGINNEHWQIIRNVVDDSFFVHPETDKSSNPQIIQLLHVSCFDEKAKNIRGILRAIQKLSQRRHDFHLTIIGTGQDFESNKIFAEKLGLTDNFVSFVGEKTPKEVHDAMVMSHICIQFSRYETAGVVLSECLAAGLPIVSTPVGIAPEIVNNDTGMLVPSENEIALTDAIDNMMNRLDTYHPEVIRSYAAPFSEANVGKQLRELYTNVLS